MKTIVYYASKDIEPDVYHGGAPSVETSENELTIVDAEMTVLAVTHLADIKKVEYYPHSEEGGQ